MKKRRRPSRLARVGLMLGVLLLAGCATIPPPRALWNLAQPNPPAAGTDREKFNLSVYDNVWSWIDGHYYDAKFNGADWPGARERHRAAAAAAKNDDELYAAINAMLGELKDRHTRAQTAAEFARSFWNVNIVIGVRSVAVLEATDGRRRIIDVTRGAPAAEAGVRAGWILLACDGRKPTEVIGSGKLKEGQVVRCDFLTDQGEARTLALVARRMSVPPFRRVVEVGDGVFVLEFDAFDQPSAAWVREQVKAHRNARALIFDVRDNPGGHVFALESIFQDIFPGRVEMGGMVHRGSPALWHRWIMGGGGAHYAGKIAVLTSPFSASAAEEFTQVVKEHGRGPIVGQRTAGALLTSVFWPLAGGGKLWFSVYDYRSPMGTRVEGNGVAPDIEVPILPRPEDVAKDPVVKAAIAALSGAGVK